MNRRHLILGLAWVAACDHRAPPPPAPPVADTIAVPDAGPTTREPWRVRGRLVGTTATHAIVLDEQLISIVIDDSTVAARAATSAEDRVPEFERLLPRLGEEESKTHVADRLPDAPVYLGGDVVVFLRGYDDVITSIAALDAAALEPAWTLDLAYHAPVRTCATDSGVVLVPPAPRPARFVDWAGNQQWLREFGAGDETVQSFACGAETVAALLRRKKRYRLRTFAAATGDLIASHKASADTDPGAGVTQTPATDPRVHQEGDWVVGEYGTPR